MDELKDGMRFKLGYALENDVEQLFYSYGELDCFKSWEVVLDLKKNYRLDGPKVLMSGLLNQAY